MPPNAESYLVNLVQRRVVVVRDCGGFPEARESRFDRVCELASGVVDLLSPDTALESVRLLRDVRSELHEDWLRVVVDDIFEVGTVVKVVVFENGEVVVAWDVHPSVLVRLCELRVKAGLVLNLAFVNIRDERGENGESASCCKEGNRECLDCTDLH